VTVTFGRIGSKGQEKAKSFANEEAAAREEVVGARAREQRVAEDGREVLRLREPR